MVASLAAREMPLGNTRRRRRRISSSSPICRRRGSSSSSSSPVTLLPGGGGIACESEQRRCDGRVQMREGNKCADKWCSMKQEMYKIATSPRIF